MDDRGAVIAGEPPVARRARVAAAGLCALAIALLWLPFLLLSAYATPALDDFIESQWGDFWSVQLWRYRTYTGRFAGSALQNLTPWHWRSLAGYRVSACVRILMLMAALGFFGWALNRAWLKATTTELLYLGCLVSLALLTNLPSPAQFFYWYSASVIYLVPFAVVLIATALLLEDGVPWPRRVRVALAALGFFLVSGTVEMLPVVVIAAGAPLAFVHRGRPWARDVAWMVGVSAAGLAISALAPGNYLRAEQMEATRRARDLVAFSADLGTSVLRIFGDWTTQRYPIVAVLLAAPVFWRRAGHGLSHVPPLVAAAAWLGSALVAYAVPFWGLGFAVGRVEALTFCVFVLGLFAWSSAVVVRLQRRWAATGRGPMAPVLVLALLVLATQALPHRNGIRRAYRELTSGRAAVYAEAERRRADLTRHAPSADVTVPVLDTVSPLVAPVVQLTRFGEDVLAATPEEWWSNNFYAAFYGKRTLRLAPADSPPRSAE
jgi:hypothetical protein